MAFNSLRDIKFDRNAGAWTDGTHYVKTSIIREYAEEKMGKEKRRGILPFNVIESYFLDVYGVVNGK